MRKCLLFLCMVLAFPLTGCIKQTKQITPPVYTRDVYEISISASLQYNNSVGNDWRKVYTCDGSPFSSGKRLEVPLGAVKTVVINATITEADKWSDVGFGSLSVDLVDGFTTSTTITITENKGRYRGNTAKWEITCKVALVDHK